MKTRGKGATKTAAEATESAKSTAPKVQLSPELANPPQLFILPRGISKEARIVTLQNPRYNSDSRYLVCPELGFYEFSKIAAPTTTPRSWLLSSSRPGEDRGSLETTADTTELDQGGYVTKDASLFIATAIDPLFNVLPALFPVPGPKVSDSKRLFLSGEDYFDRMISDSPHLASFIRMDSTRSLIESRMAAVSDTVEGGDETMYRLNEGKLLQEILSKAKKMIRNGLPLSMEEKLVRKALEQPTVTSIPQEEGTTILDEDSVPASGTETPDTQTTLSTTTGSFSETSTAATSFSESPGVALPNAHALPPIIAPDGVAELLRLRTAFSYICSAYITPHITESLKKLLATSSSVDFTLLEEHLIHLAKLRQEAQAARSLGDFSRKRGHDDDENEEKRAEKRRKEEEEKKRKANESRGVKALKKVNVTGMKKMSDFFKKK